MLNKLSHRSPVSWSLKLFYHCDEMRIPVPLFREISLGCRATRESSRTVEELCIFPDEIEECACSPRGSESNIPMPCPQNKQKHKRTATCRSQQFIQPETMPKCGDLRRTVQERTFEHLILTAVLLSTQGVLKLSHFHAST